MPWHLDGQQQPFFIVFFSYYYFRVVPLFYINVLHLVWTCLCISFSSEINIKYFSENYSLYSIELKEEKGEACVYFYPVSHKAQMCKYNIMLHVLMWHQDGTIHTFVYMLVIPRYLCTITYCFVDFFCELKYDPQFLTTVNFIELQEM